MSSDKEFAKQYQGLLNIQAARSNSSWQLQCDRHDLQSDAPHGKREIAQVQVVVMPLVRPIRRDYRYGPSAFRAIVYQPLSVPSGPSIRFAWRSLGFRSEAVYLFSRVAPVSNSEIDDSIAEANRVMLSNAKIDADSLGFAVPITEFGKDLCLSYE